MQITNKSEGYLKNNRLSQCSLIAELAYKILEKYFKTLENIGKYCKTNMINININKVKNNLAAGKTLGSC